MNAYINAYHPTSSMPEYPFAPVGWSENEAKRLARADGIELSSDHLAVIRALQSYFFAHEREGINTRELHDALHEKFHSRGGLRYLYVLFPLGPVAQGCRLAGLPVPSGAVDRSFGSVQ